MTTAFLWILGYLLLGALNFVFSVWILARLPAWKEKTEYDFADESGLMLPVFFLGWPVTFPLMLFSFLEIIWTGRPRPIRKFLIWLWRKVQP